MQDNSYNKLFTAGELAKIAGVSVRTIRFYDSKGILKPVSYSDSGYRYYDKTSIEQLQKILMLKFIGFSLEEIENIISENNVKISFDSQKTLLLRKKAHIEAIISALDEIQRIDGELLWDKMVEIINFTAQKEKIITQYTDDRNLQRRINIHAYSTSKIPWMKWVFEQLDIHSGMKILEVGCGNALLWRENIKYLPDNLEIYLTDYSQGMVNSAQKLLDEYKSVTNCRNINFKFGTADANDLIIDESGYDLIIANHMLYHVKNRRLFLERVYSLLSDNGKFCCTTIGARHMAELNDMIAEFSGESYPFSDLLNEFTLESGSDFLHSVFSRVEKKEHEDNLIVDNAEVIYDYAYSYPENIKAILDKHGNEFMDIIRTKIEKEGAMFISKSQGMFICGK